MSSVVSATRKQAAVLPTGANRVCNSGYAFQTHSPLGLETLHEVMKTCPESAASPDRRVSVLHRPRREMGFQDARDFLISVTAVGPHGTLGPLLLSMLLLQGRNNFASTHQEVARNLLHS